jgi:hypothetical protein
MKILGINFTTKKELRQQNEVLQHALDSIRFEFPFALDQVVYDISLRNNKGRYTKTHPSREHCLINEVTVDTHNYFTLVRRYQTNDVFLSKEDAEAYLDDFCEFCKLPF